MTIGPSTIYDAVKILYIVGLASAKKQGLGKKQRKFGGGRGGVASCLDPRARPSVMRCKR